MARKKKHNKSAELSESELVQEWLKKNKVTKIAMNVTGGENIVKSFFTRRKKKPSVVKTEKALKTK